MNLNPLKKDDNTDALVQALEDANNPDSKPADTGNPTDASTQVAAVPAAPGQDPATVATDDSTKSDKEESMIAADPQVMGENPLLKNDSATTKPTDDTTTAEPEVKSEEPSETKPASDDLPDGLSSDADAHLPGASSKAKNGELDEVKKDALEALRPLIDKLDLSPADKFDKYLMMLRASDDPTLIKPAYEAAAQIKGEKEKAQALLDVINEINYLTANK